MRSPSMRAIGCGLIGAILGGVLGAVATVNMPFVTLWDGLWIMWIATAFGSILGAVAPRIAEERAAQAEARLRQFRASEERAAEAEAEVARLRERLEEQGRSDKIKRDPQGAG